MSDFTVDSIIAKLSDWTTLSVKNEADKKTAIIDIEGVIGFEPWWEDDKKTTTKELMKMELKKIANLDVDSIKVRINSYGGDVNHGVSMHDLLKDSKAKVTTEVYGHTASAATIIAQAGDTRRMSSNALYLTHQAQTIAIGTADDMEATKKTLDTINAQIADIYAKRSGRTVEEMREVMDRNRGLGEWLTADEALELRLIDEVHEPMEAAASAMPTKDMLDVWNLPEIPNNPQTEETSNNEQESLTMFDKVKDALKGALNLSDEQAEILNTLPESVENVKVEMQASIDALTAEKQELSEKVEELTAKVAESESDEEKYSNANSLVESLSAETAEAKSENEELKRKLETMTAGVQPVQQVDNFEGKDIVAMIKAKAEAENTSYEKASIALFAENKELNNKYVVSKRK